MLCTLSSGRLVANRSVPGSGVTALYGTIDYTGRVELSSEVMKKTEAATVTKSVKTSRTSNKKIREMSLKKIDIQKNNQIRNSFTGVSETDKRACFT